MTYTTQYDLSQADIVDNIDDEDYIFVISPNGKLKSVLMPEDFDTMEYPEQVLKIMQIYGVSEFTSGTLH